MPFEYQVAKRAWMEELIWKKALEQGGVNDLRVAKVAVASKRAQEGLPYSVKSL